MTDTAIVPDPTTFQTIGKPTVRTEDERLVRGRGRFSDDFSMPGQAYAVMLRSPYAHARILSVDSAGAKTMPGVMGVFCGTDVLAEALAPIPHDPVPKTRYDMRLNAPGGGE